MKTIITVGILTFAMSPIVALGADAKAGEAIYMRSCKTCHGPEGHGNPAIAKVLNVTIPDLGSKEVQALKDEDIKKQITEGKGKMKPVKTVSENEIPEVITFVRAFAKK